MLAFPPIPFGGTYDWILNLEPGIEESEVLSVVSCTPDAAEVSITNVKVNTTDILGVPAGKGIAISVESIGTLRTTVNLTFEFTGDSGTKGRYYVDQPIVPGLRK